MNKNALLARWKKQAVKIILPERAKRRKNTVLFGPWIFNGRSLPWVRQTDPCRIVQHSLGGDPSDFPGKRF